MPRHLRFQSVEWAPHLITARCTQGQGLLRPEDGVNALVAGALARALEQHKGELELHHYVVMSNHLHLIISARDAHAKARFMCALSGTLARELCRYWGMRDHVWEGRYHSHELLDEEALIDAYKYVFKNSVKEGLVSHPREWPGLHGYAQLCGGAVVSGRWLDRTRWGYAERTQRGRARGEEAYVREAPITLTRPRCWVDWAPDVFDARCERWCSEAVQESLEMRAARLSEARREINGEDVDDVRLDLDVKATEVGGAEALNLALAELKPLGADAVRAQPVFVARPPSRSPRPLCRSGCDRRFAEFIERYRAFRDAFLRASGLLRAAVARGERLPHIVFPEGGVPLFIGT
jgi:REP element-mobilizing transposase RayT